MTSQRDLPLQRLVSVLRQVPAFVAVLRGPDHVFEIANPAYRKLISNRDPIGRPLREVLPEVADQGFIDLLDRVYRTGEPHIGKEVPIALRAGTDGDGAVEEHILNFAYQPDRGHEGEIIGIIVHGVDVTEEVRARRKAEEQAEQLKRQTMELEQTRAEQTFLVEAARVLASSLDYEETLTSVARLAVPRIADWCAVDVIEQGVPHRIAVVHVDPEKERLAWEVAERWPTAPDESQGLSNVLRTGLPELYPAISDEQLRTSARDEEHLKVLKALAIRSGMIVPMVARERIHGAITFISAESERIFGEDDLRAAEKLASRAAMAIDNALLFRQAERSRDEAEIAQRRAEDARRVAETANRAKSEFLANMSHEMRTPLNAVTGYTELLEMEIAGPLNAEQKSQLSRIRSSTGHLLALINDLLDLSRIEAGRVEVQREEGSLGEAVSAAVALLSRQAADRELELTSECPEAEEAVYFGDGDRVRQILVNLIGNALKFTPRGGRVRLTCGRAEHADAASLADDAGPWAFVRVEDNGVGIEAEQIDRIFRPFEQVEGGYTREAGGAGLGLAISRQLALLMGGDLGAESDPGVGSVFTLWLPATASAELLEVEARTVRHGPGLERVGTALLEGLDEGLDSYVRSLREDPLLPGATGLTEAELKDHHSTLVSDFAAALFVLARGGENRVQLLRDGSEIQRVVAELHGRQRAQLGWTEPALQREFELWRQELERVVLRSSEGQGDRVIAREGMQILEQMVERARRLSLRAFRAAMIGKGAPAN